MTIYQFACNHCGYDTVQNEEPFAIESCSNCGKETEVLDYVEAEE